jgi:hypothetical protein
VTARHGEIGGAGSAIAVELSIDEAELAERVRMMLITWPGIELLDADGGGVPQVRITDGAVQLAPNVPVIVLTDASGASRRCRPEPAVLSGCADGDVLCTTRCSRNSADQTIRPCAVARMAVRRGERMRLLQRCAWAS